MHGVVLREVGIGLRVAEIVDRQDPNLVGSTTLVQRAQDVPPDPTVPR